MKNFFTSLLGSLTALILFFVGGALLLVALLIGLAAAGGDSVVAVEKGSYLVFNTSANITDAPPPLDKAILTKLLGNTPEAHTLQLRQVTNALRAAAKDDRIAGVYMSGRLISVGYGSGLPALKEVRAALAEVKAAGKPVVAYLDEAATPDIYLASVADEVVLDPFGLIFMPGIASEPLFLAGAFERFGIGVQVTRAGKYKSAVEPFIRRDLSPENREQLQKLLDDLWSGIVADVCASRSIQPRELQALVDTQGMIKAEEALKARLVTRVAYRDEVYEQLKERTGRKGSKEPFRQVSITDYMQIARDEPIAPPAGKAPSSSGRSGKIAVVYAEGAIVDGEGEMDEVGGERFSREIRKVRQDPDVKAIVLRVNSPGGSATASEMIQRELRLARETKPVIVSMGSYAASGGYWISAYGDHIFAEATTITGSIGVFGIFFDAQRLFNNLGVTFDRVKTGKFADAMTISRPKTEEEMARLQVLIDWVYGEFLGKVSDGRKLDRAKVEEIAQGRVWSGAEAVKLGLVDEVGGLDQAIRLAADKAGLGDSYSLTEYPRRMEFAEAIAQAFSGVKPASARSTGLLSRLEQRVAEEVRWIEQYNDPKGAYARLPFLLRLN